MNANDKFYARDAHVDSAAVAPLPSSRKIHVEGSRPDIRVPMREIAQSDTPASFGSEKNPPLAVYDTSGPYTDPEARIDVRQGLPALRAQWIAERDDTMLLDSAGKFVALASTEAGIIAAWERGEQTLTRALPPPARAMRGAAAPATGSR